MDTWKRAALGELSVKSLEQIQTETARAWARRCWAAKQLAQDAQARGDWAAFARFTRDSTEYCHESLEHAALSGNDNLLQEVRQIFDEE